MHYSSFHFAEAAWLWGLLLIPVASALYKLYYGGNGSTAALERFADRHLLPHLLTKSSAATANVQKSILRWSFLWALGMLAMAGPRWNYTDLQTFKPERNLVVLLDLSKSMDAGDVKPSRLAQAREKIEDLVKMAKGTDIGLVAYAADAHMISPITDDTKPILDLLPELDTSLPAVQGNNLAPALDMAGHMLNAEPGNDKSVLVVSSGGFRDDATATAKSMAAKGIAVYTIGVGTDAGAPVPDAGDGWLRHPDGTMVISHLQADKLQALSAAGNGSYTQATYRDSGVQSVLKEITAKGRADGGTGKTVRSWQEHFAILVTIMALSVLPWFRRGAVFPVMAFLCVLILSGNNVYAADESEHWKNLFLNKAQQANASFDEGDYKKAATAFDSPYQRGVAQYKAGDYAAAQQSFAGAQAGYNLGNSQVMQQKYADAIASYESVLKRDPHNKEANHNREIARKLLELQKQQDKQDKKSGKQENKSSEKQQSPSGKDQQSGQNGQKQDPGKPQQGQDQKQQSQSVSDPQGQGQDNNRSDHKSADNKAQNKASPAKADAESQPRPSPRPAQDTSASNVPDTTQNQKQQKQARTASTGQQSPDGPMEQPMQNSQKSSEEKGSAANIDAAAPDGNEHPKTQKDVDADQWLSRIDNDPKSFLRNQFLVETQVNGTLQGAEPW